MRDSAAVAALELPTCDLHLGEPDEPRAKRSQARPPEVDREAPTLSRQSTSNLAAASAPAATPGAPAIVKLPSYDIGERIGAGGMGTVHLATHVWLGRTVAIKFISADAASDPDAVARFLRETRAIGALDHPNIVRATDAGRANGVHYLVTEFVEGQDLAKLVRGHGPLDVPDACELIRQAALGLQHAHERNLVHRDVKPSNLLLDLSGAVKLLDFGLARMTAGQTTLTSSFQVLGTLDFLAPEQANDARSVDIRSDIYSLGCTLYFLLTGRAPFSGPAYDTPASKLKGHLADLPSPPTTARGNIPRQVQAILDKMMAKLPGERFRTPAEVAAALAPFAEGAQVVELAWSDAQCRARQQTGPSLLARLWVGTNDFLEATADLLFGALARLFFGRKSAGHTPTRQPLVSFGTLIALAILAFLLSHFSCAPGPPEGQQPGIPGAGEPPAGVFQFSFGSAPPEGVQDAGPGWIFGKPPR